MSERQLVICELGGERYGLDIGRVREIIRLAPITSIPSAPSYVEGCINLRGRIIPIVDLASRFGIPPTTRSRASRIVVADTAGTLVGLVVDGVSEVLMASDELIEPTPDVARGADYLEGIARLDDRLVMLLDLARLFADGAMLLAA